MLINALFVAYIFAGLMILHLLMEMVEAIWNHKAVKALRCSAGAFILAGVVSVLVYQAEWAYRGISGAEPVWGRLNEWVYLSFFAVAFVLLMVSGGILVTQRVKRYIARQRDAAAIAPQELSANERAATLHV